MGRTTERKESTLREKNEIPPANQTEKDLEQRIEKARRNSKTGVVFMVAGGAAFMLSQRLMAEEGVFIVLGLVAMLAGLLVLGIGIAAQYSARGEMRNYLGGTVIPVVLSQVFEDLEYEKNGYIDGGLIKSVDMSFPFRFDDVIGSDHVRGTYRGVHVELSDIRLMTVSTYTATDKDGNPRTEEKRKTVFQGQWLILDFHKELSADLCVFEGGRKRSGQIETESTAFNEKFGISCDSAHDAFYILTPHMMEHILTMDQRAGGDIYLRFLKEGKVHVAVNSGRDHFEAGSLEYVKVSELLQRFRDETRYITELIDALLTVDTLYKQQEVQS